MSHDGARRSGSSRQSCRWRRQFFISLLERRRRSTRRLNWVRTSRRHLPHYTDDLVDDHFEPDLIPAEKRFVYRKNAAAEPLDDVERKFREPVARYLAILQESSLERHSDGTCTVPPSEQP